MYKRSDFTKKYYKTGEVAKILNLTIKTIQNYDHSGKLKFIRTTTNYRLMTREDLLDYLDKEGMLCDISLEKKDVIYARVSSNEQKTKGDLDRQAMFLIENVDNLINPLVLKEVGSGLNDKRKKLMELILLGFRIVLLYGNGTDIYLFGTTLHLESILVRFGLHLVSHKE